MNKNLFIITKSFENFGGRDRYIHEQITILDDKFNLFIIANKITSRIILSKHLKKINSHNILMVLYSLIFSRPDIAIIHDDIDVFVLFLLILFNPKIFYYLHTVKTSLGNPAKKHFGFLPGLGLWKVKYRLLHKISYKIVFVSNFLMIHYSKLIPRHGHKFSIAYPWIDTEKFRPNQEMKARLRKLMQIPEDATVFLYAGRICEAKRIDRLIGAFLLLKRKLYEEEIYCVIIGGNPNRHIYKNYNKFFKILDVRGDIENWYNIGDVFVLSSDRESFSFGVAEAMACGLYPVITDVAEWKKLFNERGVGLVSQKNVFDLKTKMEEALHKIKSNIIRKEYLRQIVLECFSKEKAYETHIAFFKESDMKKKNSVKNIIFYEPSSGFGGSSSFLGSLVNNLNRSRYTPIILIKNHGPQFDRIKDAEVLKLKNYTEPSKLSKFAFILFCFKNIIPEIFNIFIILKRKKISLVHINTNIISGIPMLVASRLAGIPCVCYIQQTRNLIAREKLFSSFAKKFIIQNKRCYEIYGVDIPEYKLKIIYLGIDLNDVAYKENDVEKFKMEFNLDSFPIVGLIGRIVRGKGQKEFILSAKEVLKKNPKAKFLIIGDVKGSDDQSYLNEIKELVVKSGLTENIIFTGWRQDISNVILGLTMVIQGTTTFPESFGLTIVEAMALKKPVIATDIPGPSDIVLDGETGFLVSPGDIKAMAEKIIYLLDNPEVAKAMGEKGRKRAEELFDIRKTVKQIESLYEEVLS